MEQLIELLKIFIDKPYVWVPLLFIFITLFLIQKRFEHRKEKIEHFEKSSDFLKKVESFFAMTETNNVSVFQIENGFFAYFGQKFSIKEIAFLVNIKSNAFYFFENYPKSKQYLEFDEETLSMSEKYSLVKKRIWLGFYLTMYAVFVLGGLMLAYILLTNKWNLYELIQVGIIILGALGTGMASIFEAEKIFKASQIVKLCKVN